MADPSTSHDQHAEHDVAKVLVAYAAGIDQRDWPRLRACFADECDLEYDGAGAWQTAEAITEFMVGAHAGMGHTLHRLSNIDIAVEGATAQARCYVDAVLMAPDGKSGINAVGWYDDELRSSDGQWRIVRRRYTMVRLVALDAEGDLSG